MNISEDRVFDDEAKTTVEKCLIAFQTESLIVKNDLILSLLLQLLYLYLYMYYFHFHSW